jgi:hypothetical protein
MRAIIFLSFLLLAIPAIAQKSATETRKLEGFEVVSLSGGFDQVVLQEGSSESIVIEASGVELDKIETRVKGKTLEVGMKNGRYNNVDIRLTITYRTLKELNTSGSGDVTARSTIKTSEFELNSSGSGDFEGSFDVQKLAVNISGSGDMKLKGSADRQVYAISGSADVHAEGLSGKEADVAISGSADVSLGVSGPVKKAVSGSGSVRHKGEKR